ncbi:chitobiase/beta-hexosaminidase C-terminal domain-containing protein [Myxococcota bacterium]|nr:chitobiase/beta-hexosaminidase C-terminal domain-containing protein [Myxococcota bacterium]
MNYSSYFTRTSIWSLALFSALSFAACGDDDTSGGGDKTAPTTIADPGEGTYKAPLDIVLTASEDATIYYISDGSTPDTSSSSGESPVTVTLSESATLQFFAVDDAGNIEEVQSLNYVLDGEAPTLAADPAPGIFSAAITVTLTASEDATIYYTTTGADPTESSTNGASPLEVQLAAATTIKAYAKDAVGNMSEIATFEYSFDTSFPTIENSAPEDADTEVGTFANIMLSFSEVMNRDSVEAALSLTPTAGGAAVPLAFHWYEQNAKDVLIAWPANLTDDNDVNTPFGDATSYDLVLGVGAKDLANNAIEAEFSSAFTTLANSDPIVTSISPTPGALVNQNVTEVTVTFDRSMDKTAGRLEIEGELFEDSMELSIADDDLNWNAAGTQLILTVGDPDPNQESVILRFKDLYKANGDKAPDVDISYTFNRNANADPLAPTVDMPNLSASSPLEFDPTLPFIWFSESIDPATLSHISATLAGTEAAINIDPQPGFQRSVAISTAQMEPGQSYDINIGTGLLDAAGTAIDGVTSFTVQIPADFNFGTPKVFGLSDNETAMPINSLVFFVEFPGGFDPASISNEDVKLYVSATGEPVRGMNIEVPNSFEGVSALKISMSPGMRALHTNTQYTLELTGISASGGHSYFEAAPLAFNFTTVDLAGTGFPEDARPLFDLEELTLSLSVEDAGPTVEASALLMDDGESFTVSLAGVGYTFAADLVVDPNNPMSFELPEGTAIESDSFTTGWNDMELIVNDGTNTVSIILPVYYMPSDEIPEITAPAMGAALDLDSIDISTFTFDWTHIEGDATVQILVLAEMPETGMGEPMFMDWAFLDPSVSSFPAGDRFGHLLLPTHNYALFVMKLATRLGLQGAGSAMVMGENVVLFSIIDPALGSISGSINLVAPVAGTPIVMLAHSYDALINGQAFASAIATEGDDALTYDYMLPNLSSGNYVVAVWLDVLGDDIEGDEESNKEDNMWVTYNDGELVNVNTSGTETEKNRIDIDMDLDNWAGRIDVSFTSDTAIQGNLQFVLCPSTTVQPDESCNWWQYGQEMNGAKTLERSLYYLEDGSYNVWANFDVDGDTQNDMLVASTENPIVISGDAQDATFEITVPQGSISGSITLTMAKAGATVTVIALSDGGTIEDSLRYAVTATDSAGTGSSFSYYIPYVESDAYDLYVYVDYEGDDTPEASGMPYPANITVNADDIVQNFTVTIVPS